ncbi:ferrous iron transport protein B [Breznakiella homolactica]|uniref:Ferrous iron transport protein B n=1 Tax=Breznakiella homolactica TaxID=2798577 RepID=A0A7T7XKE3_9SPIR|nr:ferrous iron transport protein B [Breznakiella homolactica]QQO07822.1 ferrous iron transport protein B [Breznakiella homolactica]
MTGNITFALAGNQNSGKTTLFNHLTGSSQRVGNFPGVTVERKDGRIKDHEYAVIVDLPGIYSLSPYTSEEIITRDFIISEKPDGIINIVDATSIERNLYLTLQLLELSVPMVIALNMMDEMRAAGNTVKVTALAKELGVPVVPISAAKNEGIHELVDCAITAARSRTKPEPRDFCSGPVHRCIHGIAHLIEDHAEQLGIPPRFAAAKLVEGDAPMEKQLRLSENEKEGIRHLAEDMENEMDTDREAALADTRYSFIEGVVSRTVVKSGKNPGRDRSTRADRLLTHRVWAIPIFLLMMLLIFWLTFGVIGQPLSDALGSALEWLSIKAGDGLSAIGVNPVVRSFITDGALTGIGTVLTFLPVIITLFFFLSLVEDSGYMARVAFVMDKPLRRLGLSGSSIVPMLLGFGCTVPAVMAARTLASERDRKMTILLTPFMSCSAKLPIYAAFTAAFFPRHSTLVMMALYVLGILIGIITALGFKHLSWFKGSPVPFVMELPNYRLPNIRSVLLLLWEKARDFLRRAFTIIFLATMVVWLLRTFDIRFNLAADQESSILASLASWTVPLFAPLGFGYWQAAVALITGFMAKEAVVSTLAVLAGTSLDALPSALAGMFSPLGAFSFLVFTLLYTPCVAAVAAVRRELKSGPAALGVVLGQCLIAWVWAFIIFQVGSFFF